VEVAFGRDGVVLAYVVTGQIDDLAWPSVTAATRASVLWRHTCFELFVRAAADDAYREFNFSPSRQWAAYQFTGYRSGMTDAGMPSAPVIDARPGNGGHVLRAALVSDCLPHLSGNSAWRFGLSAVIEDIGGRMSHWALAHPPGRPDFHHSDCFALEILPAGAP
jgi:hypothetical protein